MKDTGAVKREKTRFDLFLVDAILGRASLDLNLTERKEGRKERVDSTSRSSSIPRGSSFPGLSQAKATDTRAYNQTDEHSCRQLHDGSPAS